MRSLNMPLVLFLLICSALTGPISANDLKTGDGTKVAEKQTQEFQLPPREGKSDQPLSDFDLKSAIGDSGIKVGICIGIFLIALLMLSKKKLSKPIPREAIEVLGNVPFASRQQIQLIRFGQKLVLVESSANGLKPISEITDQVEVNRLMDLIRPRTQ